MTEYLYFQNLFNKIKKNNVKIGIVGIGYVGIQLLIQFCSKNFFTIGFDKDKKKVNKLKKGISPYSYISNTNIRPIKLFSSFSSNYEKIKFCDVIIICLPTPIKKNTKPDLSAIETIIKKIEKYLKKGQLIILESTTYPGTTREIIGKKLSRFKIGENIFLAYSPERENPGGKVPFNKITKVSSGFSNRCSVLSKLIYKKIVKNVVAASSLEEAEMTKLLENIYRSVNIGLVNELKMISKEMGIDINKVIKLASTKPFGFKPFFPGPGIGGHCIPIDPYYLYWRAKKFGQEAKFIKLAGDINIETTDWTIRNIVKILNKSKSRKRKKILILGIAYKKNIEDVRESAAIKIINNLRKKNFLVDFSDPHINFKDKDLQKIIGKSEFIKITKKNLTNYDCVILVTDHDDFDYKLITKYSNILIDTRNRLNRKQNFYNL